MKSSKDEITSRPKRAIGPSLSKIDGILGSSTLPQIIGGSSSQSPVTNDACQYLKEVKEIFYNAPSKYAHYIEIMKDFMAKRISPAEVIAKLKELFEGNQHLILGLNNFLPKAYQIIFAEEPQPSEPVEFGEAISFINKVKGRFQSEDGCMYKYFINTLNMYTKGNKSVNVVYQEVSDLFAEHPDLLSEFRHFLPDSSSTVLPACDKNYLVRCNGNSTTLDAGQLHGKMNFITSHAERNRGIDRPDVDIDLSDCDQRTPSYRLLPKDYPILIANKTEIGAEVLNDRWVLVKPGSEDHSSGSEDHSFKHMHKNPHQEALFDCEDDRYEVDMLIERASSAIMQVEELQKKITDNSIEFDSTFQITDHLTVLDLQCIQQIYAKHGDMVDCLKQNARGALPVILSRLKQQKEEWSKARVDFNKTWAAVYAKNHHKSLDPPNFHFKQQDAKSLSTKDLNYVMPQKILEGNDDLYKLIEYSCAEICGGEELRKGLNMWTRFIEPMLGAPPATDYNNSNENENGEKMTNLEGCVEDGPEDDDTSNGNLQNGVNASGAPGNAGGLVGYEMQQFDEVLFSSEGGEEKPVAAANVITTEAIEAGEHTNGSVGPLRVVQEEGDPNQNAYVALAQVPNGGVHLGE